MHQTNHMDSAYADYDRFVIDSFLKSPMSGFRLADSVAIGHAFHPAKLNSDYREKGGVAGKQKRKQWKNTTKGDIPEGYPENNCFFWNYRVCNNVSCQKKHTCRLCEGNHRATGCPREKK